MKIGVPREIKNNEYRVGMTPGSVREATHHGHLVVFELGAGLGIGHSDADYIDAGACIVDSAAEVFAEAEMIVKVKEPQAVEIAMLREDHVLFTYLHLAPDLAQTKGLMDTGCTAIAYETVTDAKGRLPLLAPMSEVAGRMSIHAGAHCLEKEKGGRGVLLGGVPGVAPADVVVLGGGVVGTNAARMAFGMLANVTVLDKSTDRLTELDDLYGERLNTIYATQDAVEKAICNADLIIGAVLVPGAAAPKLISKAQLSDLRPGAVLVDVSIDQGGCFETSRATTHADPTYIEDGIVHYCVANMPGAVSRTSAFALNNATLPRTLALADKGWKQAMADDPHLLDGLNVQGGRLTYQAVADAHRLPFSPPA